MSNHVYKTIEVTGSSKDGISEAITVAVEKAAKTVRAMDWFELAEVRGHLTDGVIDYYQATVKIGFRLD